MHSRHARLYAHVMVLFWPWLWWQLRVIGRWQRETGRDLMLGVDTFGNVRVRWVGDEPGTEPFRAPVSARLARALDPEPDARPATQPRPVSHLPAPCLRLAFAPAGRLPVPDT